MKLVSQIVIFLCFLMVCSSSCPEAEDMFPCKCEVKFNRVTISCVGKGISQLDIKRALSKIGQEQIEKLELADLHALGKLKGDLFSGYNIRELAIINCDIEALTDGEKPAFSGLEDSLETLGIISSLRGLPSLQLSHLRILNSLDFFNNELPELVDVSFPSSLEWLTISENGIKTFPDHAFANILNLSHLWLDGNKINTFRRNWLPVPSNKLTLLKLDNNQLTSLPQDAFSNMPSLIHLNLQKNSIRSMERETWEEVWQQLSSIDMEGNPLVCDSNIDWMRQLEHKPIIDGTCHQELRDWIGDASPV